MNKNNGNDRVDVLVVGGGVNGAGIARDAVGRGASVMLVEQGDLASGTSSASTKLFHGGLRYLEQYDFMLVRKALKEREILLRNTPHIAHAMRFVLPHMPGMRPAWMLRIGLFIYDHLDMGQSLPKTRVLDLRSDPAGVPLKPIFRRAFEYSDGWVDDSRLVVLNARDAADRGAQILTRTKLTAARREGGEWIADLTDLRSGRSFQQRAAVLVNAGGPWVNRVVDELKGVVSPDPVRLVRGSHIVVPKLFDHDRAYFFQLADGRIIFAIPYEGAFTLIGTTDVDHKGDPSEVVCTQEEAAYLCSAASNYFARAITPEDIVWTYAGVRPLDDTLEGNASKASRDYHLKVSDTDGKAALISIYGGKITTYRKLAEQAVAHLAPYIQLSGRPWTERAPLPGGDFVDRAAQEAKLQAEYPFLTAQNCARLIRCYGTLAEAVLGEAKHAADLGEDFGAGLTEREVHWLQLHEWAETAEDILWRRTKTGLHMDAAQRARLADWLAEA